MNNAVTAIERFDGPIKVTGQAKYSSDYALPGQVYAVLVNAQIPAGRIVSMNAKKAMAVPNVIRVLTAADMPKVHANLDQVSVPPLASRFVPMQSNDIVHEGQPVAIVLAETLEAAEQAVKLVEISYRRTPFVAPDTAPEAAIDPAKSNYSKSDKLLFEKGNAASAIQSSQYTLREVYSQPSRHANPMEPSAIVAVWNGDQLTVYDSVQHLPAVQSTLAAAFGVSAANVRVISLHTGGGFGSKAFVWSHEILACMAAKVVQRPVKLTLTRQQMYEMVGPQPQLTQALSLGSNANGKLQGIKHEVTNITGLTDDYVEFASVSGRSFYACDNIATTQSVKRGNVTLPTFMRSPWDGPGSWGLGSAVDELAHQIGMDPLAFRLANYAEVDPASGAPWSSKKLREAYEEGARRFGWHDRKATNKMDGNWHIGYGVADCSQGQARFHSTARVRLKADGTALVESSFCDIGCGTATIFPQVAAAVLGIAPTKVTASYGDTKLPYSGPTYGSGTTISTGAAVQRAALDIRSKLANLAGWPSAQVEMRDGRIFHGDASFTIQEIFQKTGVSELASDGAFDLPGNAPVDLGSAERPARTFGVIFVEVGVDPELGLLRLRRATGVYSAGRIINARTARSQMIGGITWGWGMAAMEASHYEPVLGRWLAKDLAGVAIPVNADIPPDIDVSFVDEFDANAGPLGAKGIGELGATGVAAAVANAVFDAVGIRVRELPISPAKLIRI